ncbi:hypothetical protein D7V86_24045 [bacterium D16-51]|nr:hypothetical protein D7V96_24080 [bacterium D16-59]RKI54179.1 hypothetical protein D7V86_24045 [bacterium D16-51]
MELTRSDCDILSFLKKNDYTNQLRSATLQEIMKITNNSRPTTYRKMMNLKKYGYVEKGCKSVNADTFYLCGKGNKIVEKSESSTSNLVNREYIANISYDNDSVRAKLADIIARGLMLKSIAVNAGLSESELPRFKNGVDSLKDSDVRLLAEYLNAVVIPQWNTVMPEKKLMTMRERILASKNKPKGLSALEELKAKRISK